MRPFNAQDSKPAVLNLFRLADHLTNFVSVRGPPNKFPHFHGKISDDLPILVIFPKKLSQFAHHTKISTFSRGKILTTFFSHFSKFLAFLRDKHRKNYNFHL